MLVAPLLLAAQVETSPGIATSLDAIKSMLDQLDLQMGASRALEHPCAPAMRVVGCAGFECLRAAVRESNVALPEECERALVADTRPSSSSLTVETEESEDTRWLFSSLFSAAGLLNDVFGGESDGSYFDSSSYFDYSYGSYAEPAASPLDREGGRFSPFEEGALFESMAAQAMNIFLAPDAMMPHAASARDVAEESEEGSSHPCSAESAALCPREVGSEGLMACLVASLEKLSPRCKCALHQLGGDVGQPSSRLEPPELRYVIDLVDTIGIEEADVAHPRAHCCILLAPLLALPLALLLLNCVVRSRGGDKAAAPRRGDAMLRSPAGAALEPLRVGDIRAQYIDSLPGFVPIAPAVANCEFPVVKCETGAAHIKKTMSATSSV